MKKLLSFILVLSLCLSLSSCAQAYQKHYVASAAEKLSVKHSDSKKEGYEEFVEKLDLFAAKLTYSVYSDSDKQSNVCISPVSVYMALALAIECADGKTRDEILNAVGVTYEEVKNFTGLLYAFSNRDFKYRSMLGKDKTLAFEELANSIWAHKDITLNEPGITSLANGYNCDLFKVNFETSEAEKAINAYIKDKTHGIIDGNIDFSPETLITIINTFYLKEVWNEDGDKLNFTSSSYDFKNTDGSITKTKLLQGYYFTGDIYEGEGYTSFYTRTEHGFDIKFLLPTGEHTLGEIFTAENIYTANNLGDYGYIDHENKLLHNTRVFFPEYKASFDEDISKILRDDFGIDSLFDFKECDFSNITDEKIGCEAIIHKCSIDVNERGIEGAAVTVMPMAGASGPLDGYEEVYHDFIVDRAFGFVITDSYGAVLFSGVVNSVD